MFAVCCRSPWVSGRVSYSPGPILGSVFLWRCFCRQKNFLYTENVLQHEVFKLEIGRTRRIILDVLKTIFNFVLGPPSTGGSRGRLYCQLPKVIGCFGPVPARIRGDIIV